MPVSSTATAATSLSTITTTLCLLAGWSCSRSRARSLVSSPLLNLAATCSTAAKKLQAVVQWQYLNPGQRGNDGLYSILGGLNYYIHGDDLKLMVNYVHTWSDFRQANPEFGEDQFDEVIGRVQLMF